MFIAKIKIASIVNMAIAKMSIVKIANMGIAKCVNRRKTNKNSTKNILERIHEFPHRKLWGNSFLLKNLSR